MYKKSKLLLSLFSLSTLCLFVIITTNFHSFSKRSPASNATKQIMIGIDGISKEHFDYIQNNLGLFKQFKSSATHIAPFPSISDYSWNKVVHAKDVYGKKGRIKNYEASYFDKSRNLLINDPREYFRRSGYEGHYYAGAFDIFFNPYIESFLYTPTKKLPLFELDTIKNEILSRSGEEFTSVLIASFDAVAHTQGDINYLIAALDRFFTSVINEHKKMGINAELILISDHGQSYNFELNEKQKELSVAYIQKAILNAGFSIKEKLKDPFDVVVPVLALANYVNLYFKDLDKRKLLIDKIKMNPWFDLAIYVSKRTGGSTEVTIIGKNSSAKLLITPKGKSFSFYYDSTLGDPLHIPKEIQNRVISDKDSFLGLRTNKYPDSFYRIAQTVMEDEADFPDMILSLDDKFRIKGELDQFTKMFRTHGSLAHASSNGLIATSSLVRLPSHIRTDDVLQVLGLSPNHFFEKNQNLGLLSQTKVSLEQASGAIKTGAHEYSNKRIFELINRAVHYSKYVYDISSVTSLREVFKGDLTNIDKGFDKNIFALDHSKIKKIQIITPEDIATLIDITLSKSKWEEIESDKDFIRLKTRIGNDIQSLLKIKKMPTSCSHSDHFDPKEYSRYTHGAKTIIMKQHSTPYLLEKALAFPEFDTIPDTRDLSFARGSAAISKVLMTNDSFNKPLLAKKLFSEVFKERQLVEEISPEKLATIFNPKELNEVTLVYVPGIYNSIFNNEIFGMGLDALRDNFGLRIIESPIKSGCDSVYNGEVIINSIKEDMAFLKEQGKRQHKYFILGYSKGAVDALYGFTKYPAFVKENILGLLSIASPILGSQILSKSDIPIMLLELLSSEPIPTVCRKEHWASLTITPDAANRFFKEHEKSLSTLTRYFSLSFQSDIKKSHPWMQATKQIAAFKEKNDGVVELSSSKFPDSFSAVDLGVIEADHLAGIVASNFPQSAFMESLFITLDRLEAFNANYKSRWLELATYKSPLTTSDDHKKRITSLLGKKISVAERIKSQLANTPYAINDIQISKQRGGVGYIVQYHKQSNDFRFQNLFHYNFIEVVKNENELIELILSKVQKSGADLLAGNREFWRLYPVSSRKPISLPLNSMHYVSDYRINLKNSAEFLEKNSVTPFDSGKYSSGIKIIYDHQTPEQFRAEYQFNYESSTSVAPDNNPESGWISHMTSEGDVVAKLASKNTSIRLTTSSIRFKPIDFQKMSLKIKVTNNVENANVLFGGTGKDDSAFQVWFTVRFTEKTARESFSAKDPTVIFGYYFGDEVKGRTLEDGSIYENYYSNKNYLVAQLPIAKQLLLGHKKESLGVFTDYKRNIFEDLKKAFPDKDISKAEIVGVTFQHDSNDTKGDSEAFFKHLIFEP